MVITLAPDASAPTWNEARTDVGVESATSIQQGQAIEGGPGNDPDDFLLQLGEFQADVFAVVGVQCAVGCLDGQFRAYGSWHRKSCRRQILPFDKERCHH